MKITRADFNTIQEQNPNLSSYMCFAQLCRKVKMTHYEIRKWFRKLVEKEDYLNSEITGIYKHLDNICKK